MYQARIYPGDPSQPFRLSIKGELSRSQDLCSFLPPLPVNPSTPLPPSLWQARHQACPARYDSSEERKVGLSRMVGAFQHNDSWMNLIPMLDQVIENTAMEWFLFMQAALKMTFGMQEKPCTLTTDNNTNVLALDQATH